ncbi:MAG TPA: hypothetical protein PLB55_14545 [Prosthecobacter sp.]|nr:hypothetical protein [Prosthecobacter sp.]
MHVIFKSEMVKKMRFTWGWTQILDSALAFMIAWLHSESYAAALRQPSLRFLAVNLYGRDGQRTGVLRSAFERSPKAVAHSA